ncbi:protein with peroxisomal targeting peptide, partial [Thalassiosira pseudonana CCMP1335]
PTKTYNYFAYGSNMASSTMVNLRELSPLASSAAVLPMHALRFNIPGLVGVEPSSASRRWGEMVHGVLYKLSSADFASVCQTEGVPFAYCLHRCPQTINNNEWGIPAFTLRAARKEWRLPNKDIPPSQSYLNVLLRGAKEFALDQSYVQKLE